ncbi:bromodomain adjacent to zinc finger domain 2B toutatis isoform X5 [Rhodnius prolixus]|uniref:bromodomain adjacent to zinc finger domain 2B toutatis isoform X5 n=1 Tax=Rhodnius prolixus TaxID=13249 RepID=UPI003D18AA6D
MEKENAAATTDREKDKPTPNILDAASLFGASYWPRPEGSNSTSGNSNPLFGAYTGAAAYSGLLGRAAGAAAAAGGFAGAANPYGTLSVAASQAANLGINTASAAWWSMASQLAAHDYLASLQFAGLAPNMIPPYPLIPTPPHLGSGSKGLHSKSAATTSATSATTSPSVSTSAPPVTTTSTSSSSSSSSNSDNILGVRLPPDTEIIKYTSSMIGPKIPGTTNRGRKKTISLDVPNMGHNSHKSRGSKSSYVGLDLSGKSKEIASVDDAFYRYGAESGDRAELIKLGLSNGRSSPAAPQDDGPLNLSLKPDNPGINHNNNTALQSLSALSQNLGQTDRNRRKPGPKPRRIPPFTQSESSHLSSGSEENDSSTSVHKDGRPRNLGRGVSKPKKNTVASLLAQSRALGIKPGLEISHLAALAKSASNLEKDKDESNMSSSSPNSLQEQAHSYLGFGKSSEEISNKLLGTDGLSGDSHSELSESSSDSDGERKRDRDSMSNDDGPSGKRRKIAIDEMKLREALDKGWRRETYITSVGRAGVKGEVVYTSPCGRTFRHFSDLVKFLEKNASELTRDHFSFSCRILLGDYIESVQGKEPIRLSEETLSLKLQEVVAQQRAALDQNKLERDRMVLAAKEAKRIAKEEAAKQKEQIRLQKEQERNERQEAARKEKEQRSQQMLEGRKRLAFTSEEKWRIIREIESGKSKSDVSRELGLANSTVATIWKQRGNVMPTPGASPARKKKQEELERQRLEGLQRKQQKQSGYSLVKLHSNQYLCKQQLNASNERELKRQQAAIIKEQMYMQELNKQREILYTVELERERRRQHMALLKVLEVRKRMEEREKKRLEQRAEKLATREKRMEQRKVEVELLRELRKPVEDMELNDTKPLPELNRIPGLRLSGQAFADTLMVFEFLHNFGETLGFDMESLPSLNSLQDALLGESEEAEEELMSVITQLVICGIEDPGIPHPARHTTLLCHSLKQADISHNNLSEILRIYLYANATGELKATTGVHFEREREKRMTEHHNNMAETIEESTGKNSAFFALLKENNTYKMSEWLKKRPFLSLNPTKKAAILAFLCHELLQNKAVIRQIDSAIETVAQLKRERWPIEANLRKLKHLHARKNKAIGVPGTKEGEAGTGAATATATTATTTTTTATATTTTTATATTGGNEDEAEVESCNESDITQPEEDELAKINVSETLAVVSKQAEVNTKALADFSSQLRATCIGQDRFCRRYWCLSTGVYIEAMESAEPDKYNAKDDPEPDENIQSENTSITTPEMKMEVESERDPNENFEEVTPKEEKMDSSTLTDSTVKKEEIISEIKTEVKKEIVKEMKEEETNTNCSSTPEKSGTPKSLQFERLGEFMEKESNAVNGCIMNNNNNNSFVEEIQRFNILPKEPCDFTSITSSQPGYRCWTESGGELRIPVLQYTGCPSPCPSPLPLPLSVEEAALLEHCKAHGLPKPGKPKPIPPDYKKGWWKISEEKVKEVVASLEPRGVREREFLASITRLRTDHMWESTLKSCTSGDPSRSELKIVPGSETSNEQPGPDPPDSWNEEAALRVDLAALAQVEALEEKVASASMQLKGWKVPPRISTSGIPFQPACSASQPDLNPVAIAKDRLLQLFEAIERRYLKPPLGTNTGDVKLAVSGGCSTNIQSGEDGSGASEASRDCKGLMVWREALNKSQTAAQLAMVQQALEASIAWDKSIMKAVSPLQNAQTNCQFCHSGDNEDKLLLCDGCDKGYHTYCFKPKMENIPEGDWYCHQCLNKAKGEKNCIVCGKKVGRNLLACEACPIAFHTDCMNPPLSKVPRGKWYCAGCASKHPKKKATRRSQPAINSPSPLKSEEITNSTENLHIGTTEEESGSSTLKKEKTGKRLNKELAPCRIILDELEGHDEAWPFLLAVNTKQFPTYKKVIRNPMDLQTIGKRLTNNDYKSRDDFASDVRLIFDNCEKFNEDYSPVGKAGHTLRLFFETRWAELTNTKGQG